jgi:hypothetical protein
MKNWHVLTLVALTASLILGYKRYETYKVETAISEAATCVAECYTYVEKRAFSDGVLESDMYEYMSRAFDLCCTKCGVEIR